MQEQTANKQRDGSSNNKSNLSTKKKFTIMEMKNHFKEFISDWIWLRRESASLNICQEKCPKLKCRIISKGNIHVIGVSERKERKEEKKYSK